MLVVIPISFAEDVNDANVVGVNNDSAVDVVSESAVDDVEIYSSDSSAEVLGVDDYEIDISPNTASVSDYTPGESKLVSYSINSGSYVDESDLGYCDNLLLIVNGGSGIETSFSPTLSTIWLNLNTIPASSLHAGENTVKFGFTTGDTNYLEQFYTITSNSMIVNVVDSGSGSGGDDDDDDSIWVNGSYTGDTTDGKKSTPYKTIADGINAAASGGTVKIAEGNYAINSAVTLRKNIDIVGVGDVNITGSNSYLFTASGVYTMTFTNINFVNINSGSAVLYYAKDQNKGTLKFIDCSFIDNQGACLVYASTYVTLEGCTFIGNSFTGTTTTGGESILFNYYGGGIQYDVEYCMFIDNNIASGHLFHDWSNGAKLTANNNYWGSNDQPVISSIFNNGASSTTLENWIILDGGATDVNAGDVVDLDIEFKSTTDGETFTELDKYLSNLTLTLQPTYGTVSPSVVTLSNNKATVTYTATEECNESIVVKNGDATLGPIEFAVGESLVGKIFVDASYAGEDSDGSKAKPYTSIKDAYNNIGSNNQIIVFDGEYTLKSQMIGKDISITGKGDNVIIKTDGAVILTVTAGHTVNLTNLIFTGATARAIVPAGTLNIADCLFTGNSGTSVISTTPATVLNVTHTVFINNSVQNIIDGKGVGVVDYNFWGSNDEPNVGNLTLNNYVIINTTIPNMRENNELEEDITYDICSNFVLNDGTELTKSLRGVTLTFTSTIGSVNESADMVDNQAVVQFVSNERGEGQIDVILNNETIKTFEFTVIERETGRIFVDASYEGDDSDGSKAKPFTTIQEAVALNNNGDGGNEIIVYEGTYAAYNNVITKDVTITGRGNVVFDVLTTGGTNPGFFAGYTSSTNHYLKVNNIVFINSGRQQLLQYSNEIVMNNCTVVNASYSGGIIQAASSGSILVNNSVFTNLAYTSNTAPFSFSSSSGTITVANSVFNNVTHSSSYLFSGNVVDINGNFWGTNTPTGIVSSYYSSALSNWVVANIVLPETIVAGNTETLSVELKLNNGDELTDVLPTFDLGLTSLLENTFTPETITISNNAGSVAYGAINNGAEVINLTSGDVVVDSVERDIQEGDDPAKIFVDETYAGTDADGSKNKPFNNLKDAFDAITATRNTIVVLEGDYSISDYTLSSDVTVRWSKKQVKITANNLVIDADVTFDNLVFNNGNAITVTANNKLSINNSAFIGNDGVIKSSGDLEIYNSQFINNAAVDGAVISALSGNVNIALSEFVANGEGLLVKAESGVTGDINNNYWGSNDAPNVSESIKPTNWVALLISLADDSINASEVQDLTIAFKNTTDGATFTDLAEDMSELNITITPAIGAVDKTSIVLKDSETVKYTATTEGSETIEFATSDVKFDELAFDVGKSVAGKIFVNISYDGGNSDGSRLRPFTDVESAISAASSNNEIVIYEGTYTTDSYYSAGYKNLIFTGVGEVILTRTPASGSYGGGQLFTLNGYTYTFNNIIFANIDASNAYYNYGSVFYMSSSDAVTLNINNCTFENNTAQKGVIYLTNSYGYGNVNVVGTKFINNTASNSYLIEYNGGRGYHLTISNSVFIDNTYRTYLVYNKGSGYADIDLNDNFWGSNELPSDVTVASVMPTTWVIVEASMDADTITAGETHTLTVTFNSTNGESITQLSGALPDVELNLASVLNGIDETVTISNNVAEVTYDAVKDGDEVINVSAGENTLVTLEFIVEELDDGTKVFVNESYVGESDGSKEKPFTNLEDALDYAKDSGKTFVSVAEGNYEISDYTIASDVEIVGKKTVVVKATDLTINANNVTFVNLIFDDGNAITVSPNAGLSIYNSTFTNNDGVIQSGGDLLINGSVFINNSAIDSKGIINALAGSIKISYSEFVNSVGSSVIVYSEIAGDVNNNYWADNENINVSDIIKPTTWIKLVAAIDDDVKQGREYEIALNFVLNDDSELDVVMPELDVDLSAVIGTVTPSIVTVVDNKATTTYTSGVEGSEVISILDGATELSFDVTEDEEGKIYVDGSVETTGDGSKTAPYKTIEEALTKNTQLGGNQEIIVMEGTYSPATYYNIGRAVTITGRGTVILTSSNADQYYFIRDDAGSDYNAGYDLTLNNLIFENITLASTYNYQYSIIYYHGYGSYYGTPTYTNLNVFNCTFNNNKAYYGVIYGSKYANLNATGNVFVNNTGTTAAYIYLYSNVQSFTMNYNIFVDNKYGGYYGGVRGPSNGNVDYNFWGTNNKPVSYSDYGTISVVNNWIVCDIEIDNDNIGVGDSANVTVTFKYTTDGETFTDLEKSMPKFTFTLSKLIGEIPEEVTIENNVAQVIYDAIATGEENITLSAADKEINILSFNVSLKTSSLVAEDLEMSYKDGSKWNVTLVDANGDAISDAVVGIGINGKVYNVRTDANGVAGLIINLAPGTYNINATFDETSVYEGSFVNATITVGAAESVLSADNLVMTYKDGSAWAVTLTDANGVAISGVNIAFGINGATYNIKTDADGVAKLAVNLAPKTYDINASFAGNKYYSEAFVNATVTVEKAVATLTASDLEMTYKDGSAWAVTLTDANGNVLSGVSIAFGIKGTTYNIKTDDNGIAKLPINLAIGEYPITATLNNPYYEAEAIENTVTVKDMEADIVASDVNMTYKDGTAYEVQLVDSEGNNVAISNIVVKITIKGSTYNVKTDANGIAKLPINLYVGTYDISAEYNGKVINNTIVVNKA